MAYTDAYLDSTVHGATRIQLVRTLYRAALDAVAQARAHLKSGAIRERSRQIMKAWEILGELSRSLDHSAGKDLSKSLSELYGYMQAKLLEANSNQSDPPLQQVEHLLSTLAEAWNLVPEVDCTY